MSYFTQIIEMTVEPKEQDQILSKKTSDYLVNRFEALKYELERLVGDEIKIDIEYR